MTAESSKPVPREPTQEMIDRFLSWRLPDDFGPDCYISFDRARAKQNNGWPVGTNLLTAEQAKAMLTHVLAAPLAPDAEPTKESNMICDQDLKLPDDDRTLCYLIERGQPEDHTPTIWWTGVERNGEPYAGLWTELANEAKRFRTAPEAQRYAESGDGPGHLFRVTEHIFMGRDRDPEDWATLPVEAPHLYTVRLYPCGCYANGPGDVPSWCPQHGVAP